MEIPGKERHSRDSQRLIQARNTDYCQECKNIIEDQCVRYGDQRWHIACFQCKKCERSLKTTSGSVMNGQLYCTTCVHASPCTFDYVSRLAQYSYLLRIALSRLCSLLQITDSQLSNVDYSTKLNSAKAAASHILKDMPPNMLNASIELQQMMEERGHMETIYPTEIKDAKTVSSSTTRLDRKMSRSFKMANKRSTILGNTTLPTRTDSLHRRSVGLDDLPQMAAVAVSATTTNSRQAPPENIHIATGLSGKPRIYLSELSALQYMIIRYVAVVQIESYVRSSFTSAELLNMVETKKSSIWGKFFTPFKVKKNVQPKAKEIGTFGVPLDVLTDRTGVESNLALGPSPVRLTGSIENKDYNRFGYTENVVISGICVTTEPGLLPKKFKKYFYYSKPDIICLKYSFTLNRTLRHSPHFRIREQEEWISDTDQCEFSFYMDDEYKNRQVHKRCQVEFGLFQRRHHCRR
ncbi:hypothetical protein RMATCC62417_10060 [Rhizopus microsporus]|nr:hypothetical protein RMATCC62417_10060 [Rhizopus microsporus]